MKATLTWSVAPYLEDLEKAGADIDLVAQEVLSDLQEPIKEHMDTLLKRSSESWTGATEKTLFADPVVQEGNFSFIKFGAHTEQDPAGIYKEYGTARQAAEPFLRPTKTWVRAKVRKALKDVMIRMGLDV